MAGDFHLLRHATKRVWIAHVLNVLFPGIGLMYWRRDASGLFWLSCTLTSLVALMSFWMMYPFVPQLLVSLIILFWTGVQWILFEEVSTHPPTESQWRRAPYGVAPFTGLALLCISVISLVAYLSLTRVYSWVHVRDYSMFPLLLPGDVVLVDRRVKQSRFQTGQLVVYNSTTTGHTIARIIASPREAKRVEVNGVQVSYDTQLVPLNPVSLKVDRFTEKEKALLSQRRFYRERPLFPRSKDQSNQDKELGWFVSEPIDRPTRNLSLSGHLGRNTLLVLPDARNQRDQQVGGRGEIIDYSRVIGTPVLIINSASSDPRLATRRGLSLLSD